MSHKTLALTLLFSALCVQVAEISAVSDGIPITHINDYNFQYVAMIHVVEDRITCSGFVYGGNTVITAASCFDRATDAFSTVYVQNAGSGEVYLHENYNKQTKENNIAVILLNDPMPFQEGLTLASENSTASTACTVSGFGSTEPELEHTLTAYYEDVTVTECADATVGQTCAGVANGEDVHGVLCEGDLGAPLVCSKTLVGIAVTENSCGTGSPDVYVNIQDYKEWIDVKSAMEREVAPEPTQ